MKYILLLLAFFTCTSIIFAQQTKTFTHADTLRGSLNANRTWWDVQRYDLTVQPDYESKTITGKTVITYKVVSKSYPAFMQIDLQQPLIIDSISFNNHRSLNFKQEENVCIVNAPKQVYNSSAAITIYYHGKPKEAIRPPWDGGWIWTKDSLDRPWMSVACQGLGASVWYPCKDYQGDEPDKGASITIIVPDSLMAVGNGRLTNTQKKGNGTTSYTWSIVNPINNYNIIPYIGFYKNKAEVYPGLKGNLDVNYWVLDYNYPKIETKLAPDVNRMLKAFEYWFGPYPFYEDGYKLVDAPHLGMEHQSAVAYGNGYQNGYHGIDLSGTGWGMKWDFIIVHESGHEWFANNITTKDLADMWVHEGFTNYSETLFIDYYYGKDAADEYNYGVRKRIQNDKPIIAHYGVNEEGSGDMYYKGGNMLHTIRHSMNDDAKFRNVLHGLNKIFYHKTVTTQQIESTFSKLAGFDYNKVFDQYLRTTQIPTFEYYFNNDSSKVYYRYDSCVAGFNLPIALHNDTANIKVYPTDEWKNSAVNKQQAGLFTKEGIEKMYYLNVKAMSAAAQ
ncbi:M1 family metallopeptidase [Ilyomonas limi]|uniref:M1 family metallopeptidase n=1 Tax=Ilyomonas limi TaxID=2575867 RepID=A0A4U3L2U2_9BACT|nr:M1 family metallopeptidase [Ilyomonas limi]TKK68589.1 M1 family metallopeptidase [Ilyomonas limi]